MLVMIIWWSSSGASAAGFENKASMQQLEEATRLRQSVSSLQYDLSVCLSQAKERDPKPPFTAAASSIPSPVNRWYHMPYVCAKYMNIECLFIHIFPYTFSSTHHPKLPCVDRLIPQIDANIHVLFDTELFFSSRGRLKFYFKRIWNICTHNLTNAFSRQNRLPTSTCWWCRLPLVHKRYFIDTE